MSNGRRLRIIKPEEGKYSSWNLLQDKIPVSTREGSGDSQRLEPMQSISEPVDF
jgi:hypothetical protein